MNPRFFLGDTQVLATPLLVVGTHCLGFDEVAGSEAEMDAPTTTKKAIM